KIYQNELSGGIKQVEGYLIDTVALNDLRDEYITTEITLVQRVAIKKYKLQYKDEFIISPTTEHLIKELKESIIKDIIENGLQQIRDRYNREKEENIKSFKTSERT